MEGRAGISWNDYNTLQVGTKVSECIHFDGLINFLVVYSTTNFTAKAMRAITLPHKHFLDPSTMLVVSDLRAILHTKCLKSLGNILYLCLVPA